MPFQTSPIPGRNVAAGVILVVDGERWYVRRTVGYTANGWQRDGYLTCELLEQGEGLDTGRLRQLPIGQVYQRTGDRTDLDRARLRWLDGEQSGGRPKRHEPAA